MNAVNRADIDAGTVLDADALRHDDERQLTTLPIRLAFLAKGPRAFIGILRLQRRHQGRQAFGLRLVNRQVAGLFDAFLNCFDRQRLQGGSVT